MESLPTHEIWRGEVIRLTVERLIHHGGKPLLPVTMAYATEKWLGEDGTIFWVDQDVDVCSPKFSSYLVEFEASALWEARHAPHQRSAFAFRTRTRVGDAVASELGLVRDAPASDAFTTWWLGDGIWLTEDCDPWLWPEPQTRFLSLDLEAAVRAVQAVLRVASDTLVEWSGPNGPPPGPGETIAARAKWGLYSTAEAVGELLLIGAPGAYRAHRYLDEAHARWMTDETKRALCA